MRPSEIDWRSGKVVFWDLGSVDLQRPLREQVSELKEDLAQVEFPGRILIDVGWYPEFSIKGAFRISVVRNSNWDEPLLQEACPSGTVLVASLKKAIALAESVATRKPDEIS